MQRYNKGDKVKTINFWNNGFGTIIPKGSVVEIIWDNGEQCHCNFQGAEAWFNHEDLGDDVENATVKTTKGEEITDKEKILEIINWCDSDDFESIVYEYLTSNIDDFSIIRMSNFIDKLNHCWLHPMICRIEEQS